MNGFFIGIIIIDMLSLGMNLAKDGEPKEGNYNFFAALIGTLISLLITYMAIKTGF